MTLTFDANNRLCPVYNILAYFGKFSLIDVSKILNFGELFQVKAKGQGQGHSCAVFHKLKYEPSLKSL